MIRKAEKGDRAAILKIAEAQTARYPMRLDFEKLHAAVTEALAGRHFALVVEKDGEIKGVLLGIVSDNLWAARQNCNIALWVSEVPGAGAKMLREFKKWVKSGRFIKVAGMCPDIDLDPRIYELLERTGFVKHGGTFLLYN